MNLIDLKINITTKKSISKISLELNGKKITVLCHAPENIYGKNELTIDKDLFLSQLEKIKNNKAFQFSVENHNKNSLVEKITFYFAPNSSQSTNMFNIIFIFRNSNGSYWCHNYISDLNDIVTFLKKQLKINPNSFATKKDWLNYQKNLEGF